MNYNNPLISVIVPVYKVEPYLSTCVDSVLAQTYKNLEIILVDDGSPDRCGEICDEYAQKHPHIRVIHKENGGLSSARNAGMREMRGEYVSFVDSDDTIRPEMIETLYNHLTQSSADISICKFEYCSKQEGNDRDEPPQEHELKVFSRDEALENLLISKYYGGQMCTKLFKREIVKDLYLDESILFIEDLEFSTRAMIRAKRVCYTPAVLYNYFLRDSSLLHSAFAPRHYTAHEAGLKIIKTLKENGLYERLRPYADAAVVTSNMILMRKLYASKQHRKEYCPLVKKNIRSHLSKKSFCLLARATKIRVILMATSCNLYFLALKFHL